MANSRDEMARLARLEKAFGGLATDVGDLKSAAWKTTEILADHSERLSGLQRAMDGMQRAMDGMQRTMDDRLGAVTDRLDRLIAVTIQERTASTERLGDIERRLARLEERAGI